MTSARQPPGAAGRFRKRPVEIEAWWWDGMATADQRPEWVNAACKADHNEGVLAIKTLEGTMWAQAGDWIIRGVKNEVYPCKPDIFAATYDAIEAEP
jgi:hypothetical protein